MSIAAMTLDARNILIEGVDALIENWGKDCRLVYPGIFEECTNCLQHAGIGGVSLTTYRHGGPMPFTTGNCPLCNNNGKFRTKEVTENIKVLCEWNPSEFIQLFPNLDVRQPYSIIRIKSHLRYLPKLNKADYIIVQLNIDGHTHYKYKLLSEPSDSYNIAQGKYLVAFLERI